MTTRALKTFLWLYAAAALVILAIIIAGYFATR